MKKLIFGLSFAIIAIFAVSCKQAGTVDTGALQETYENRMDSLKITLIRAYNTKMDSMQSAYETKVRELEIQVANASSPNKGVSGKGNSYPGSKGSTKGNSSSTTTPKGTPTNPAKVDVKQRGKNAANKVGDAINKAAKKVDVTKRGGGN